jgi:hypothetical protein
LPNVKFNGLILGLTCFIQMMKSNSRWNILRGIWMFAEFSSIFWQT